jgi:selenium metabolism protein YedF
MLEPDCEKVRVLVDRDVAAENIQRLAGSEGWEVVAERLGEETRLTLSRPAGANVTGRRGDRVTTTAAADSPLHPLTQSPPQPVSPSTRPANVVVLLSSDVFGTGEDELGRILMRAFVKTLGELEPLPTKILFANAGVRLTTKGSNLIDDLRELESAGVEILSCGTCLDYFGLVDALEVGAKTNMYEIVSALAEADRVIRP